MGAILEAIGIGGAEGGAAAGAGAGVAATAGESAGLGAAEGGLAAGAGESSALGSTAATLGTQAAVTNPYDPEFGSDPIKSLDAVGKPSSQALNNFKPEQGGFLDDLGNFGKNFGLEIAKNLVQNTLRDIPGGKTIGLAFQRTFDSPTIKNLFADPNDELSKKDELIKLLLRQRLGKA